MQGSYRLIKSNSRAFEGQFLNSQGLKITEGAEWATLHNLKV